MKTKRVRFEKEYNGKKYLLVAFKRECFDHFVDVEIYVYNPKALLLKWDYIEGRGFSLKEFESVERGIELVFSRFLEREEYREKSKEKWNNFCNKY